jgi:hypothetical protein
LILELKSSANISTLYSSTGLIATRPFCLVF